MRHQRTLTITSLLSILLFLIHWTDDVVRGIEGGGVELLSVRGLFFDRRAKST